MSRIGSHVWKPIISALAVCVLLATFFIGRSSGSQAVPTGMVVAAVGTTTTYFTIDPNHADVAFQAALNALPDTGGKLQTTTIGKLTFQATVTRAINNVVIECSGPGTDLVYDGTQPIFTAGGSGWIGRDFTTDSGGVSGTWVLQNVTAGNVRSNDNVSTTVNGATLSGPSGRNVAYVIAASDATAIEKAQADYVCLGYSVLSATLSGTVLAGPNAITPPHTAGTTITVTGNGTVTITLAAGQTATARSGTAAVTGSPQTLTAGPNTVTVAGAGVFYVSGMGDEATINNVIAMLPHAGGDNRDGGEIHLTGGTFNLFGPVTTAQNGVTLSGAGDSITTTHGTTKLRLAANVNSNMIYAHDAFNLWIKGMLLDGNKDNQAKGSNARGILIKTVNHPKITDVGVLYTAYTGIEITDCTGVFMQYVDSEYTNSYSFYFSNLTRGMIMDVAAIKLPTDLGDVQFEVTSCVLMKFIGDHASASVNKSWEVNQTTLTDFVDCSSHESRGTGWDVVGSSYNTWTGGTVNNAGGGSSNAYDGMVFTGGSSHNSVSGMKFFNDAKYNVMRYDITEQSANSDYNVFSDNIMGSFGTGGIHKMGSHTIASNNQGWIVPGETRTYSGTINGGNVNEVSAIDNPFGQSVRVVKVDLEITNQSVPGGSLSTGIGPNNTAEYASMFNALPTDVGTSYPYYYTSTLKPGTQTVPVNWETGTGNRYLNFYNKSTDTGLTLTYTITVMGN